MLRDWVVGWGLICAPLYELHPVTPTTVRARNPNARRNAEIERRRLRNPSPKNRTLGSISASAEVARGAEDVVAVTATVADPVRASIDWEPMLQVTFAGALQEKENAPRKFAIGAAVIEKLAGCPAATVTVGGLAVTEKSGW
jgi:hypothetical protein